MKAWQCSPDCAVWGEGLAHIHCFSCCWHEQSNSCGFRATGTILWSGPPNPMRSKVRNVGSECNLLSWLGSISFHHGDLLNLSKFQKINPSNRAHILTEEPGPTGLGSRTLYSPNCRPHGSNHLTLEHWHLWEHRPTTTAFTTSSLRAHGFLTQLHNINKHVCTQEVKQSNPSGTKCWQGMSKWRGGRWGVLLTTKVGSGPRVKGLKGLNPDLRTSHSKVMHHVCHASK